MCFWNNLYFEEIYDYEILSLIIRMKNIYDYEILLLELTLITLLLILK